MRELRFDAADGVWRVAFAFDPERKAILLVAGDKSGQSERTFYRRLIAIAIAKMRTVIARRPKVGQDAVSKLETRSDMYVSTLRAVLGAMGGKLELIVRFADRPPVRLQDLGGPSPRRKRDRCAAA